MLPLSSPASSLDFSAERRTMVDCQVRTFDVTDQPLIARMLDIPRERFLPDHLASIAYCDKALDVGDAQGERRRLLPPMILARLLQAASVRPQDKALDVAGGGGYSAAILAGLAESVMAVECSEELTTSAEKRFAGLGMTNAQAATGSLTDAAGEEGPFDVILVNGAVETGLERLLSLLADGGRLVTIQRAADDVTGLAARAVRWQRSSEGFGLRPLFNASAPLLQAFARKKEFAF
ncbi:MAG TPA: methyltransferase domain-containing protein [Beijerinckiaceae bacterium]|nr:methyltransferase domain-containing protein [Beijerinckiaceae bacterium]